ncbi:MAG: SMI1/KNR4 family protein [Gemmataceae bacterium]|nr:SMI1/KNR4 family protein [Gemmataceae bacterium]
MRDEREIVREIEELTRPWRGPLLSFSGPVSEDEVAWAERELGVPFPPSYRTFVRHFGSGQVHHYKLLGVRAASLWDDVVASNHLAFPRLPSHLIRVVETLDEHTFHLDTSQPDANGECPVRVYGPGASGRVVARNYLDLLHKICAGLEAPVWADSSRNGTEKNVAAPSRR